MNFKLKFSVLVACFALSSCLEHNEATESNEVKESKKDSNRLTFEIDLETSNADDFVLFANDVFLNNSQFMNIGITHKLNMNETSKKIKFEFPENIKPDAMLGFGLGNKNTKEVTIKNINLSYGDAVFNIHQNEIQNYFSFNKFIEYDSIANTIKTKKVDNALNPLLFLRRKILDSIQKVD
ncbi:MAG: hypothetical protein R2797_02320 [Gelidibacter sp.]